MNTGSPNRDSLRLIDSIIDQRHDDAAVEDLNRRIVEDPTFRRHYMESMFMEAELHALHATSEQEPACDLDLLYDPPRSSRRWSTVFAIAAMVGLVAAGSSWITYMVSNPTQQTIAEVQPLTEGAAVARISGTRDCLWGNQSMPTGFGTPLVAGQEIDLVEGLAEITFDNGSRLLLEGPSRFVVPDSDRVKLIAGRLSAAVPETAVGFSVESHRVAVDTAGTQFGLVAHGDGTNEVHVFDGPIEARMLDLQGMEVQRVQLNMTEAARFTQVSDRYDRFSADRSSFASSLDASTGPSDGLLVVEEFDYQPGPIAQLNGGFGWAGPWEELNRATSAEEFTTNLVTDGSLMGSTLVSRGNRIRQTGQFNRIRRLLSTSLNSVFAVEGLIEDQNGTQLIGREGRTVYVSFLQRTSITDDLFYGLELHRADGNLNRVLSIGCGAEFTGYGVSSNYNGEETPNSDRTVCNPLFESLGQEDTDTHLYVVRIDFGPYNQDVATVYRDPASLLDEQSCVATASLKGDFAFDRVSIANYDGVKGKIHDVDEIRIGTSFAAVTGQRANQGGSLTMWQLPTNYVYPHQLGVTNCSQNLWDAAKIELLLGTFSSTLAN